MHVLVAEADASLAELLRSRLEQEQFTVRIIAHFSDLSHLSEGPPVDLVILDRNLPGPPDVDPLQGVQYRWPETPVILLSREASAEERVHGLNSGADDFLVQPFDVAELVARARAVLRRRCRCASDVFRFEDLEINRVSHQVSRGGRTIELSPKEYALLEYLLRNPGRPVSRGSIIEQVWRMQGDTITNVVDVYINYLRRKIDAGSGHPLIRTIRGVGYQIGENHAAR